MNTAERLVTLNRIRRLSRLMDTAIRIPGIGFRIGLDPILGLVPGAGDLITAGLSGYIILSAARFGLPRDILAKMLLNVALESTVGSVPLVGDLFDAYYKANMRNLALLEKHLEVTQPELIEVESAQSVVTSQV